LAPDRDAGIVAEREPNGSAARAQVLPPLDPRSTLVVAGEGGTDASATGAVDPTDAYRVVCRERQEVAVVLRSATGGVLGPGDFDLAAIDTATGDPLASATGSANPQVAAFVLEADAPADLVVTCVAGAGAYTLEIETGDAPGALALAAPVALLSVEALDYVLVEPDVVPARLLVRAEEGAIDEAALDGARVVRRTAGGTLVVEFEPRFFDTGGREAAARAARLASLAGVRFAEPDGLVRAQAEPPDAAFARQWHLPAVAAGSAWEATFGDPSVVVGIVDSGVAAHPDLAGQAAPGGYDFVSNPTVGGDGDGRDPDPTDPGAHDLFDGTSQWHGTHVAGIACARADAGGVVGLAPGCRFLPLRAVGRGGGSVSDLADAIRYSAGLSPTDDGPALANPPRVVNLSLGTTLDSQELEDACAAAYGAGTLLVGASGNTGGPVLYPAAYPTVLAVGGADARLLRAEYSNFGPSLDLLAPGGEDQRDRDGDGFPDGILSCSIDETRVPRVPGLSFISGTSMAAPLVAATAALLWSVDPTLSREEVVAILLSTAKDRGVPGPDTAAGAGVLHAGDAVKAALALAGTPRTGPPVPRLSCTSLRFREGESTWTVYVYDEGGGGLVLGTPLVATDSGVPWLHASTVPSPTLGPLDVPQVHVSVDPGVRALLAPGAYAGTVHVTDGTSVRGSVRVVMEVGPPPVTGQTFQVVAQETGSGIVRASGFAHALEGNRYVLIDLPPGSYVVKAGTDLDDDGFFCEAADLCGRHGGFDTPVPVVVDAGERATGVDVAVD
jgi:serine protease